MIGIQEREKLRHNYCELGNTTRRYITLIHAQLQELPLTPDYQAFLKEKRPAFIRSPREYLTSSASRDKSIALYQTIQSMRRDGWNIAQLANKLGHHRDTICKYYYATAFPE